ncbi:MAG TPA: histone deacetylase [Candidatus Sulfotelmatobacter sp.]|nr:histone deacetylase [Candidatus Sulfotelmatobacter sp.]
MRACYSDQHAFPLPPGHSFPIDKYRLIREQLLAEGTLRPAELLVPTLAHPADICQAHARGYWDQVQAGRLPANAVRRIGLPWSEALVRRAQASVQGTLTAARIALHEGAAVNLAGGTHHAFEDRGEGYCLLNDIAIAARCLQRDFWMQRMAVIDCDVHQGNGTAAIFAGDPDVFTFSIHAANNYPLHKIPGHLDIALPDRSGDEAYLLALQPAVARILADFRPGLVFYQAGVDPHERDRLGRLALTHRGLLERDGLVFGACRDANVPVVVTLGGGYGQDLGDTVEAHCNTIRTARRLFR